MLADLQGIWVSENGGVVVMVDKGVCQCQKWCRCRVESMEKGLRKKEKKIKSINSSKYENPYIRSPVSSVLLCVHMF
jgi:hypothetical protein